MDADINDLFEGLQIMSAEELNSAVESKNEGGEPLEDSSEEFTLTPVVAEKGDDTTTRESKATQVAATETKDSGSNENKNEIVYKALMKSNKPIAE